MNGERKMTINAIVKEIQKRIEYLEEKYEELYHHMISCKVRGDSKGQDEAINKRLEISIEKRKLLNMLAEYAK